MIDPTKALADDLAKIGVGLATFAFALGFVVGYVVRWLS